MGVVDQVIEQVADREACGLPSSRLRLSPHDHAALRHEVWMTPAADAHRVLGLHTVEPTTPKDCEMFYGLRVVIEPGPLRVDSPS